MATGHLGAIVVSGAPRSRLLSLLSSYMTEAAVVSSGDTPPISSAAEGVAGPVLRTLGGGQ